MKNFAIHAITIVCLFAICSSCDLDFRYKRGNGDIELQEYSPGSFNTVICGGNYKVKLVRSDEPGLSIETDENLLRYIKVDLFDQQLHISNVHNLKSTRGIMIEIRYSQLEKIVSTGSSAIKHKGTLQEHDLEINMTGAGSVKMDIDTESVRLNLSGAGLVDLMGVSDQQDIIISGAGGYQASNLISNVCRITLSGVGGAKVQVDSLLNATITGVGGIVYSGDPKIIQKQITGFGKIERQEDDS